MTPRRRHQTVLHDPDGRRFGNCVRAAVASIMGLPIREVPPFEAGYWDDGFDWRKAVKSWAAKVHGVHVQWFCGPPPAGWAIASGPTARGTRHVVVCRDGRLWHDPHPDHKGLINADYWVTFAPSARGSRP